MKQVSLSGQPRAGVGKKDAAELRAQDMIPCVLYGGKDQIHFSVKKIELSKVVFSPDVYQVNLEINGSTSPSIIQELQWHPVTNEILHVDFLTVSDEKAVKLELPVRITGTSPGVIMGGKLSTPYKKIKVEGTLSSLPEAITVDITNLNIGDGVRVKDLQYPGLKFHAPAASEVVGVKMARGAKKAGDEEPAGKK
jgi:large subunit ribosomal protein L25